MSLAVLVIIILTKICFFHSSYSSAAQHSLLNEIVKLITQKNNVFVILLKPQMSTLAVFQEMEN